MWKVWVEVEPDFAVVIIIAVYFEVMYNLLVVFF